MNINNYLTVLFILLFCLIGSVAYADTYSFNDDEEEGYPVMFASGMSALDIGDTKAGSLLGLAGGPARAETRGMATGMFADFLRDRERESGAGYTLLE